MISTSVRESVAGAVWIYIANVAVALGGFIFWILMAKISGLEALGLASAIVSAASIATTFISAGMNIAIVREVASRGLEAFWTSIAIAVALGLASSGLAIGFASALGVGYGGLCALLAFFTVISASLTSSLIGYGRFRCLAFTAIASTIVKICVGIAIALAGIYVVAPLLGYVSYPIAASVASLAFLTPSLSRPKLSREEAKRLATYIYTNYPVVFSNQLTIMLNIYLYALMSKKIVSTGALYLAFSIAIAISAIPGSLLSASLPVSIREGSSSISESARIGLAIATPLSAFLIASPKSVLSLISKESAIASTSLAILAFSIPPLIILTAAVNELNRIGAPRQVATIGLIRLATLLATLPPLATLAGVDGAALSYLISTCTPIPYAAKFVETRVKLAKCWLILAIPMALYLSLGSRVSLGVLSAVASIALLRLLRIAYLRDFKMVTQIVLRELAFSRKRVS